MSTKEEMLHTIQQSIIDKKVCPELASQATQLVFGDGNANADIMFIGEAPGKNEDIQGLPFVGAAGKFLNEMLQMIGLNRSDIYITNIVKYRPPNNRDPLPDEKKAFLPYLTEQLKIIKPKLIVTLGRHSMEVLMPANLRISQVHGQPKRMTWERLLRRTGSFGADTMQGTGKQRTEPYQEYAEDAAEPVTQQYAANARGAASSARNRSGASVVCLPLFHPAAALYNGAMRQILIDDFSKIPAILQQIKK